MSLEEAPRLWAEHRVAPFPSRLRGKGVEGVDMVMLDADIAGCVDTWLRSGGWLDDERREWLRSCFDDLGRVLPGIRKSVPTTSGWTSSLDSRSPN
jgi:hypothetical protein